MKQNYKLLNKKLPLRKKVLLCSVVLLSAYLLVLGMAGVYPNEVNAQEGSDMEWEFQSSGTIENLYNVIWDNNLFVAVGANGVILTSLDGIVWEKQDSGTERTLYDITFGDGKFVAVGGWGVILTSPDGIVWEKQDSVTERSLYGITFGDGKFVAVNGGVVLYSSDGLNWIKNENVGNAGLAEIIWANGLYVAVGNGNQVITSPDGINWTDRMWDSGVYLYTSVAWSGNDFLAVGFLQVTDNAEDRGGLSLTSVDGVVWDLPDELDLPPNPLYSVTYHNGKYVAVGGMYGFETEAYGIFATTDGINWTTLSSGESSVLKGIASDNGKLVAVGNNGAILTSTSDFAPKPPIPPINGLDPSQFIINLMVNPLGGGVVSGDGIYYDGQEATIVATPERGYLFVNWTKNGQELSVSKSYTLTVLADQIINANFNLYGDINNDGDINVVDAVAVMRHILELEELTKHQVLAADVNNDGEVNVIDVSLIMHKALGLIEEFPYQDH